MIPMLGIFRKIALLLLCALLPTTVAAATVPLAFFPLLNLSQGPNGIDIPYTSELIDRLTGEGTVIVPLESVIAFMALNRIRSAGQLESYQLKLVQEELGASFVLLGSVVQSKEEPISSLGVTLSLIRIYDARTIWSYTGAVSRADIRRPLGIGEAGSVAELQALLADEVVSNWPADVISQERQSPIAIDSLVLEPKVVRPGGEIHAMVRLRNQWPAGRSPLVFFKADDQVHAGSFLPATNSFEATWIAGEMDGRFSVDLLLEWPLYDRIESLSLGSYDVDGVPPLVALDLKGEALAGDPPVFREKVMMLPSLIVRKPIERWRITIKDSNGRVAATQEDHGNIPARLTWSGAGEEFVSSMGAVSGIYRAIFDVWDEAGNTSTASREFELNRTSPVVAVVADKKDQEVLVNLQRDDKVPLAYWRLEMWSEEGRLLKEVEGQELPPPISVALTPEEQSQKIEGILETQDILGNRARQKIKDFFPPPSPEEADKKKAGQSATETWVNDF